ncbi:MAG TPA: MarR family transcriptional regulator [Candidatus Angelobacter sp.]|nr:MarR family transcriptional regulator [Candidatus Angelobacter sp.]
MPQEPFDAAIADMANSIGQLVRRMRAATAAHELSLTESSVLARLARNGPATTAELARAESVKPQSMGATIAALEELGMVERKPHPTDGRQVNIVLTSRGATVRKNSRDAKRTWLAQAIAQLSKQEQETLFAASRIMKRLVESDRT